MPHLQVVKVNGDIPTDQALMVSTASREEVAGWDRSKIIDSLKIETKLADTTIAEIAEAVENQIRQSGLERVTTNQVRELIDGELVRRGYGATLRGTGLMGIPAKNLHAILTGANTENSNTTYNPESVNLTIAELMMKQYALAYVYSQDVAEAHLKGDIHIHDMGMVVRPYCGGHSLEYVKKYGLALPNITSVSGPAKHADVLVGHMVKMASTLQMNYAGAVGWEAVNTFFAPFIEGMDYVEVKQIAQMLIFEFNQLAGARGGQVVFSDFNIYYGVPERFQETPALVPGGKYRAVKDNGLLGTIEAKETSQELPEGYRWLTYKDFEWESNLFARALFDVYLDGDAVGKTFFFPKPLLHINPEGLASPGWDELFDLACRVASVKGTTYFVFDREDACVSACCRLKLKWNAKDIKNAKTPEKLRFSALQNTTINLPRIAYKAEGDTDKLYELLGEAVELVARSHIQKRKFVRKLLAMGTEGPLSFFAEARDGGPYMKVEDLTCLVGILGLNECVQYHTGKQLHEGNKPLEFGLEIIDKMYDMVEEATERYKVKMVIEETPAESSGYRLATLDLNEYPEQAASVMKGDAGNGRYYYTNSIHMAVEAPVDYVERLQKQSRFHPYIKGGAIIHVWLGEHEPSPASIAKLVMKTYEKTECHQVAFSPDFTVCEACARTTRGIQDKCEQCGSEDVYSLTRIVGYFSKIQSWNQGKRAELDDRVREQMA